MISEKAGPIDGRMLSITTMSPSRMDTTFSSADKPSLDASHIDDLRQAAAKMLGAQRRSFEAAMAVKYCRGSARQAEVMFGWSRQTIELGLHERRSGVICLGAQEAFCGNKLWEE